MKEGRTRSVLKAFSWRITATLITILASYFILGDITPALSIGFLEFFSKIGIYYMHERLWVHIPVGQAKTPAAEPVAQQMAPVDSAGISS